MALKILSGPLRLGSGGGVQIKVSSGFNPASYGTVLANWDFSLLALADGTAIGSVPDTGGTAGTITQATGANKPTFKTGIQNSRGVGRFAGSHFLAASSALLNNAGDTARIFIVCAGSSNIAYDVIGTRTATDGWICRLAATATPFQYHHIGNSNSNGPATNTAVWHTHEGVRTAAANTSALTDGVVGTGSASGFTASAGTTTWVGGPGTINNNLFAGDIGQIVIFSSMTNVTGFRAALKARWATP